MWLILEIWQYFDNKAILEEESASYLWNIIASLISIYENVKTHNISHGLWGFQFQYLQKNYCYVIYYNHEAKAVHIPHSKSSGFILSWSIESIVIQVKHLLINIPPKDYLVTVCHSKLQSLSIALSAYCQTINLHINKRLMGHYQ